VSDAVTLTLRTAPDAPLDVSEIVPDRFAALSTAQIAALPVWIGAREATVGDFFAVDGGNAPRVRVVGSHARLDGLGGGMAGGELIVEGDAGRELAAGMTGGAVEVRGSVGDGAGAAMAGGTLRVAGDAGDRLGAATAGASKGMTGGEIVVGGSAGRETAARARRGLVVVCGDVGERGARSMIAGSLIVLGRAGAGAGEGSKRGSVVAVGGVEVPATYAYACTYRPPHLRLTFTYLRRRYGIAVDERAVTGLYRRYCGDAGDVGKGEILQWLAE
jgi:formylmethanofuran dehydrogenase subunit C